MATSGVWVILVHRRPPRGSDRTVQEVDLTGGGTLKLTYSDLGSTPPITAPANATEMAPDAVPPDFTGGGKVYPNPATPPK
jgi:hypothetical protein